MIQSVAMLALDTAAVVTRPGRDSDTAITLKTIRGAVCVCKSLLYLTSVAV